MGRDCSFYMIAFNSSGDRLAPSLFLKFIMAQIYSQCVGGYLKIPLHIGKLESPDRRVGKTIKYPIEKLIKKRLLTLKVEQINCKKYFKTRQDFVIIPNIS